MELQIEPEDKEYNLVAYIIKNSEENGVLLGKFETKKEAEEALHQVKNKLFNGGKSLLTIGNSIVLIVVYTAFVIGFAQSFKTESHPNMAALSALSTGNMPTMPNMNLNGVSGGNVNMADMSKLQKQLLQQALQQAGQPGGTGVANVPSMANNPLANSGSAMDSIVSDAIQQAQGQSPVAGQPMPQATNTPQAIQAVEQHRTPGDEILGQIR